MQLTPSDLLTILKDKPNAKTLDFARKQSKKLTAHITGIGNDELLEQVTGLENDKQLSLRKKFAKSNMDMFSRVHRPEDKIFSAKGGSTYYQISESQQKELIARLNNIYKGYSIREWVERIALKYYHIDPMGLIFVEVNKDSIAYPTYISSNDIYDYKLNGRKLDYVIIKTADPIIFRVVDEKRDYLVKFEGQDISEMADESYPNYFGEVPATIISDLVATNMDYFVSPDHEIVEIADEFLREGSVKSIYKLKHAFPKAWQYQSTCKTCNGTGLSEAEECKSCNGTGNQITTDASETITLPIPTADQPAIAPNVAGYATPDIEGWNKMTEEQTLLENLIHSTYWGIKDRVKAVGIGSEKTATEIIDDMQPLNDRLHKFSKWAENIESFVVTLIGKFYFSGSFSCSISYGKRYTLESPDAIWMKYQNAREKGSPTSVLDELLMEYYYSKYDNNSIELNKYIKLMKVEPFVHLTMKEGFDLILDKSDYNKKLYFNQWLNALPPNELIYKSVEQLDASLTQYVQAKVIII